MARKVRSGRKNMRRKKNTYRRKTIRRKRTLRSKNYSRKKVRQSHKSTIRGGTWAGKIYHQEYLVQLKSALKRHTSTVDINGVPWQPFIESQQTGTTDDYLPKGLQGVVLAVLGDGTYLEVGFLPMVFAEKDFNEIFEKGPVTKASDSKVGGFVQIREHRKLTRNYHAKTPLEQEVTFTGRQYDADSKLLNDYDEGIIYNKWTRHRRVVSDQKYWGVCMKKYTQIVPKLAVELLTDNSLQKNNEGRQYTYSTSRTVQGSYNESGLPRVVWGSTTAHWPTGLNYDKTFNPVREQNINL